ncbi:MAG: phosphoribosylamine--glycine ligase [Deltaproteobacteria bacterium]|jgi:phosphoribosylamine--glycine ligase|nr:phosphoribosylamine--glycine ligase [Deltaproteobacteria bacterium]
MKILLVGSGGREHALGWKLKQNPETVLHSAPGSPALKRLGEIHPVGVDNLEGLRDLARTLDPDLVIIGPELPLVMGLADILREEKFNVFGPSRDAARLEGSKVFAKDFMVRHGLPTANYAVFYDESEAKSYLDKTSYPAVLKADGLAGGKGVIVCGGRAAAMNALDTLRATGAGKRIIVEEFLAGEEISFLAVTDGKTVLPLPSSQDHKTISDGDKGPNTGGMGAYSPAPLANDFLKNHVMETIMKPAIEGMAAEGNPFVGVLYAGLMVTLAGPRLLEFNARFGDPETQAILPLIESDLAETLLAAASKTLPDRELAISPKSCVCVVMSSEGYPGPHRLDDPITGLDAANALPDTVVFEAGVAERDGIPVTAGGRVLGVTATGATLKDAVDRAYEAAKLVDFKGAHYRRDIAAKAFKVNPLSG